MDIYIKMNGIVKLEKKNHLPFLLALISIHSFLVGVGLMLFPGQVMEFFGFQFVQERFFQVQAGLFHILMSICYILPVVNYNNFKNFVLFSIIVKISATIFLFIYFLFFDSILCLLLSGFGDCTMAFLLIYVYQKRVKELTEK
jgi:hypothetical protein